MATFRGQARTNNTFTGTATADVFLWAAADLNRLDRASGLGGADTLRLTTGGALGGTALDGITGIERFVLAAGGNAITLKDANFAGVAGAKITVTGGAGADRIDGSALTGARALDVAAGAGLDVLKGGAGNDLFRFARADLLGDTVVGGLGNDRLQLTTAGVLESGALAKVSGVETFKLAAGGNTIKLLNANFAGVAGAKIAVLGGAGDDIVNGAAVGGGRAFVFNTGTGLDTLSGGSGADEFRFAANALAFDTVRGGGGVDTLVLTTAGALAAGGLSLTSGVETITLNAGGNGVALQNSNFSGVAGAIITVAGGAGNDTVDASGVTGSRAITVSAGGGLDALTGGRGDDVFRFLATDLAGDTIAGRAGFDTLVIGRAANLADNTLDSAALANMTGIDAIRLGSTGTGLTLIDANFAVPVVGDGAGSGRIAIFATSGTSVIDAADLTGSNAILVIDGRGNDTVIGGAGDDVVRYDPFTAVAAGDSFDGGAGTDTILFADAMDFLGSGITNVERLLFTGAANANITISGANAAGLSQIGTREFDTFTQVFTVRLESGSTTDLSNLFSFNATGDDALKVVSTGGTTAVTLSSGVRSFTGSADADTVRLAEGGSYASGAVIDGGGGDDRIAYGQSIVTLLGGTGNDTLVVIGGINYPIDLSNLADQSETDAAVTGFENVDAAGSVQGVTIKGRDDVVSTLIGGAFFDTITAGAAGATINGGLGFDNLLGGAGQDLFVVRSTADVETDLGGMLAGDTINGAGGEDGIQVRGDADLSNAIISGIETLYLGAADDAGVYIEQNLTATVLGAQAATLKNVFGNSDFNTTVETLVVISAGNLNLSSLNFFNWTASDRVEINGNGGADTITGTSQNDVIDGGNGADTITAGGGDDVIRYVAGQTQYIDGATGTDTVRVDNTADLLLEINLKEDTIYISTGGPLELVNASQIENVDNSASQTNTLIIGSDAANALIGGSAGDTITGGLGADTLTGGDGSDRFMWNSVADGGDRVTDFVSGIDKLAFQASAFAVAGAFDTFAFQAVGVTGDITTTDLLFLGTRLESAAEVRAYLDTQENETDHGMFVVAADAGGSVSLYYTANATFDVAGNEVFEIADLGPAGAPQLADFVFIV